MIDNPPAFPSSEVDPRNFAPTHYHGMSLRDWFAGQALAGWLASFSNGEAVRIPGLGVFTYEVADAMLIERAATKEHSL